MKRLLSIGSWPWWSFALIVLGWVVAYGFWLVQRLRSTAAWLAELCSHRTLATVLNRSLRRSPASRIARPHLLTLREESRYKAAATWVLIAPERGWSS